MQKQERLKTLTGKTIRGLLPLPLKNNPKIAIAVLVENAGCGASWAGPIATLMMEKYLNGKVVRKDLEKTMMDANLIDNMQVKEEKKKK